MVERKTAKPCFKSFRLYIFVRFLVLVTMPLTLLYVVGKHKKVSPDYPSFLVILRNDAYFLIKEMMNAAVYCDIRQ